MSQLAVIIPTRDRANMIGPLLENISTVTTVPHRVYLVIENTDAASKLAAARTPAVQVLGTFGSCAVAVNAGYRASEEPFVAVANDDCVFHPEWDTNALCRFTERIHVVGLNDGHGDCKCFPMVRRSFIERHSGVFDQPNTLFHTYKSQGPDTEFAFYAMLRGVWTPAPDAIVEHRRIDPDLHTKARETINEDLAEYNRRWPLWDPQRVMPPAVPTVTPI